MISLGLETFITATAVGGTGKQFLLKTESQEVVASQHPTPGAVPLAVKEGATGFEVELGPPEQDLEAAVRKLWHQITFKHRISLSEIETLTTTIKEKAKLVQMAV
jgi:hypothetical protein